jgi:RecA-family ATPase
MINELVTGLIPEHQVSILAGASGAGKTTLLLQILKQIADGHHDVWGMPCIQPMTLGYVVADRTKQDLLTTAEALGFPMTDLGIPVRSLVDDKAIDIGKFEQTPLELLFDILKGMLPRRLIVVDPLIIFTGVDTNKYHLNAAKLIRINRFCMDHECTILGTHHATKARSDFSFKRAQDRISGSSALLGYTSTQLFLASPEETDDKDGLSQWTIVSHHAAPKTIFLSRIGAGFLPVRTVEASPSIPLDARIVELLSTHPMKAGELIDALRPAGRATVYRALERSESAGVVVKTQWGHYRLASQADHPES